MNLLMSNAGLGLIAALAYLVGSFPTAYFVSKGMTGKDIRFEGSGNVGGMNAYSLIKSNRYVNINIVAISFEMGMRCDGQLNKQVAWPAAS